MKNPDTFKAPFYGVFNGEGLQPEPLAMFFDLEEAKAYAKGRGPYHFVAVCEVEGRWDNHIDSTVS